MRVVAAFFLLFRLSLATLRQKRQVELATESGVDVPITLRSLITCLTPGIREYICLGPRTELFKKERIAMSDDRYGAAYGMRNGVDLRLLKPLNIPMIEQQTEIGNSYGAVVDVKPEDGVVEFGNRRRIFKLTDFNSGGVVEWDRQGAGVDISHRAQFADDSVKLKITNFGVNVGPTSNRKYVGPSPKTIGHAKLQDLKPSNNLVPYVYNGYYTPPDWYRAQFERPGDEHKTGHQRSCPWCYVFEGDYPVQSIFSRRR